MSAVRVLVGPARAFRADVGRPARAVGDARPSLRRLEVYHVKGSPADPSAVRVAVERMVRAAHPAVERRREDVGGGRQRVRLRRRAGHPPVVRRDAEALEFKRVWHLEPSRTDPTPCGPGRGRGALRTVDGGTTWQELSRLRVTTPARPGSRRRRMCLHTILVDPVDPRRMFVAISAAASFGPTTRPNLEADQPRAALRADPRSRGAGRPLRAPDRHAPLAPLGPVHAEALGRHAQRRRRRVVAEVSGNLPSDFGFPIDVHATSRTPSTSSPSRATPSTTRRRKLRVYRSRTGGGEWEPLTKGLPQRDCYVNVLREAMSVDSLTRAGSTSGRPGDRCTPRMTRDT